MKTNISTIEYKLPKNGELNKGNTIKFYDAGSGYEQTTVLGKPFFKKTYELTRKVEKTITGVEITECTTPMFHDPTTQYEQQKIAEYKETLESLKEIAKNDDSDSSMFKLEEIIKIKDKNTVAIIESINDFEILNTRRPSETISGSIEYAANITYWIAKKKDK